MDGDDFSRPTFQELQGGPVKVAAPKARVTLWVLYPWRNKRNLKPMKYEGNMKGRLLVGTSGWSYDDWVGLVYPEGLERTQWLAYYATRFSAVEINVSFYRLPFEGMVRGWSQRAPEGFVFAAKGSRLVTHRMRLRAPDQVARFYERMQQLKGLEVVLWQLPPSLRCDLALLDEFLSALPPAPRCAVEFRHRSWWESEETANILCRHNAAFCGVSHPRLPPSFPFTADFCYVRFHGLGQRLYDYDYSKEEMAPVAGRVAEAIASGRDAYVFFNNDYHANAVKNAEVFNELVRQAVG